MYILSSLIHSVSLEISHGSHPSTKRGSHTKAWTPDPGGQFESVCHTQEIVSDQPHKVSSFSRVGCHSAKESFKENILCRLLCNFLLYATLPTSCSHLNFTELQCPSSQLSKITILSLVNSAPHPIPKSRNYLQTAWAMVVITLFSSS